MSFSHLFTPHNIGPVTVPNRIMSTAHQTILARNGAPSEDMAAYHEARAKGGAGLIVIESARPFKDDVSQSYYIDASTDACIDGYRLIAEAVHRHGGKVFAQINHGGRISYTFDGMAQVSHAPSRVPDHRFHCMPRVMSVDYIATLVEAFAAAAARIVSAGIDGIELAASHGLLIAQFLNPQTNLRDDEYGGSDENRFRFARELIAATRAAIGPEKALGLRISADEKEPDGLDAAAWLKICARLDREADVDFLNVTAGSMTGLAGSVHVVPPMMEDHAYLAPAAGAIRDVFSRSVLVAGRINQPQLAEQVLAANQADICGMTRALISDPEMPVKASAGKLDDIRACIGCNQACIGHYHQGVRISCIQHPITGRELTLSDMPPASAQKSILVAGGGPAGMKAAAVAASRGHKVLLCEASNRLGGQVHLAAALPGRTEFGVLTENLSREMQTAGVEVRLNTAVDAGFCLENSFDEIIIATGGRPFQPAAEIGEDVHAANVWQVLQGEVNTGSRVVIADWRCDWTGIGMAEKLARDGCHVRLCVDGEMAGQNLQKYLRYSWAGKLHALGVETIPCARLFGADGDTVYFQHTLSGEAVICEETDTLVLAQGQEPDTTLENGLRENGFGGRLHLAGDCLSPRTAEEAIYEGFMIGREI